jgi:hypothetical protein
VITITQVCDFSKLSAEQIKEELQLVKESSEPEVYAALCEKLIPELLERLKVHEDREEMEYQNYLDARDDIYD